MFDPESPATIGMITPFAIWIGVLGKTLVDKGVLDRQDLIREFEKIRSKVTDEGMIAELGGMIDTVNGW
jgi:hypothetical protein